MCHSAAAQWAKSWQPIDGFDVFVHADSINKSRNTTKDGSGVVVAAWVGWDFDKAIEGKNGTAARSLRQRVTIYCDAQTYIDGEMHLFGQPALSGGQVERLTPQYFNHLPIAPDTSYAVLAKRYCNWWKVWQ
jgi:hypothetical protein